MLLKFDDNNINYKLIFSIILIQIVYLIIIFLRLFGLNIVFLSQIIIFIYLMFVPGTLLLGIFKVKNMSISEYVIYSILISLSFLMILGFLFDIIFLYININRPMTSLYLITVISISILFLDILFLKSNNFEILSNSVRKFNINELLLLSILPFLSIFSTYYLMYFKNNVLLLFVFLIISIIPLVKMFKNSMSNFKFIVWSIASSLVLYNSLYGKYMRPTDNIFEYFISSNIIKTGLWNPVAPYPLNATLGTAILTPIFSIMLDLSIIWVYKIIIPLLSTIIPVGLFEIFSRVKDETTAFLASIFFATMFPYFTWASVTTKMVLAGLFLMALVLTIVNRKLDDVRKKIFICIFSFSLVVSHYGTSYIFFFSVLLSLLLIYIFKIFNNYRHTIIKYQERMHFVRINFATYYMLLAIGWYIYSASAKTFSNIVLTIRNVITNILSGAIFPKGTSGSKLLFGNYPLSLEIIKYIYIFSGLLIFVGLITNITKYIKNKNTLDEYTIITIPFFIFFIAPYVFGGVYGTGRIWYIQLIVLAPLCVDGWGYLSKVVFRNYKIQKNTIYKTFSIFLIIFILFNTGFIPEVIMKNNPSASVYVSAERIKKSGSVDEIEYFYRVYLTEYDVCSAKWLSKYRDPTLRIFTGHWRMTLFMFLGKNVSYYSNPIITPKSKFKSGYIYLRYLNIHYNIMTVIKGKIKGPGIYASIYNTTEIYPILTTSNKIYTNNGSVVYIRQQR